ncbi:hypothetical protein Tco_0765807 [Tanacetum coccineum]
MVLMVEQNRGEHLIRRFVGQLQQDSPAEEAETESNVWDDGSEDVNPFGGGNPGFHDDHYDNPLLTKETKSEPIIWDIGDEEEEHPFVNKYLSFQEEPIMLVEEEFFPVYDTDNEKEESMPVYDTDIEDVIEEEEGFVGKEGFGGEQDKIEDVVVVANDLCSSMIQTILSVDFEEDIITKSHELMSFEKSIILKRICEEFSTITLPLLRHALHSNIFDEKLKSFSCERLGENVCQLILCSYKIQLNHLIFHLLLDDVMFDVNMLGSGVLDVVAT